MGVPEHNHGTDNCCMPKDVTITVKNTFVHINIPDRHEGGKPKRVLRPCNTEPADMLLTPQGKHQDTMIPCNAVPSDPSTVPMPLPVTEASRTEPPVSGLASNVQSSVSIPFSDNTVVIPENINPADKFSEIWEQSIMYTPPHSPRIAETPTTPDEMWTPQQTWQWDDFIGQMPSPQTPNTSPSTQLPEYSWETPPLCASPSSPVLPTNPMSTLMANSGIKTFNFTLRRAHGVGLGVDMLPNSVSQMLIVRTILAGGAIEAWNWQCVGGPKASMCVMPGDLVMSVNSKTNVQEMLEECEKNVLLNLHIARLPPGCEFHLAWLAATMCMYDGNIIPLRLPAEENTFGNKGAITLASLLSA